MLPLLFPSAKYAGVTQLVECNLAKVDVASSSLVTRSLLCKSMTYREVLTEMRMKVE